MSRRIARVAASSIAIIACALCAISCSELGDSGTYLLDPESREGLVLPAGFPAGMPIYPHATSKELTWNEWDVGGSPRTTYRLTFTGNPVDIHEWYVAQLTAAGWDVDIGSSDPSQGHLVVTASSPEGIGLYYIWLGRGDSLSLNIETRRRLDYRPSNNEAVTWVPLVEPPTRRIFFVALGALLGWLVPSRVTVPLTTLVRTRRRRDSLDALMRSSSVLPWEPGPVARLLFGLGTFVSVALLGFPELFPSTGAFVLTVLVVAVGVTLAPTIALLVLAGRD